MKIIGIIAEFNPYHNGHKEHIMDAKAIAGADYAVAVMSGDFTQRGRPAIMDKYTRTRIALENGIDLVLELPVYSAAGSAEYFSNGAVCLFDKLGIIDEITFGSECGNIEILTKIANASINETDEYKRQFKNKIREGISYPQAKSQALEYIMKDSSIANVLSKPNNILGIEYIKSLILIKSNIKPTTFKRKGAGYHNAELSEMYSSGLAIRQALSCCGGDLSVLRPQFTKSAFDIINEEYNKSLPIFDEDLSSILHYKLMLDYAEGYTKYADVSNDLSCRIQNNLDHYTSFIDFCDRLKTKGMTHARISRALLHIALDMKQCDLNSYAGGGYAYYARILGFRQDAAPLLGLLKERSKLPIISKLADAKKQLSPWASAVLSQDILASSIYMSIQASKFKSPLKNEYRSKIVKV